MKALVGFVCLSLGLAFLFTFVDTGAAQAETCWLVFYVSQGDPGDTPDEIICLKTENEGYVRESSIFGSGVKGCNSVTVSNPGNGMDFNVDYSKCTNDAPSHKITCPSPEGDRFKCTWEMLDGSMSPADTYLQREN